MKKGNTRTSRGGKKKDTNLTSAKFGRQRPALAGTGKGGKKKK